MSDGEELWTLEELTERVRRTIDDRSLEQASGRIRQIPDGRTIRYYTTLGILDRPAGVKNRRRLYNERHLRQLLSIKRLQAEGLALSEIQRKLLGADDEDLVEISSRLEPVVAPEESRAFWRTLPGAERRQAVPREREGPATLDVGAPLAGLRLGLRVTLNIEGLPRALTEDERRALLVASAPLLAEARRLGLIEDGEEGR